MALVARHRRAGEPDTTRTRLVRLTVVLGLLGFVVGVEATDLVPGELEPLLYRIFGLGVIADFLVAFGHRPSIRRWQIGDIRCVHATEEGPAHTCYFRTGAGWLLYEVLG
jgi:hypothetical protein